MPYLYFTQRRQALVSFILSWSCIIVGLYNSHVVPTSKPRLQKEAGTTATQFALRNDCDSITQYVSFIHEVGGQDDSSSYLKQTIALNTQAW